MRVNVQQNNNNNKISIMRMISFPPMVPYTERAMPVLASHITFLPESESSSTWNIDLPVQQKPRLRKKKIFQHKQQDKAVQVEPDFSYQQTKKQEKQLRKVKSNAKIETNRLKEKNNINGRINEINQLLQQHRQERIAHFGQNSLKQTSESKQALIKIQQKLSESTFLMKKQEQVLTTKIPNFQKKIADNQTAIVEMSNLIKSKIEQDTKNMENIVNLVNKSQSRLKIKENELNQINSKLLQKESQLIKNREINRKKELELIRIKRIEDLQNKNLELYQQIQKKNSVNHFQNYVEDQNGGRQGWEDEEQPHLFKFSHNQQSTIRYADGPFNTSANNTIGEILSPLALNENNYLA